jgi:CAAX amino terminal protease family.
MERKFIIGSSLIACIFLYFIEQVISANYAVKTFAKILIFVFIPYIYITYLKKGTVSKSLNFKKIDRNHMKLGILFGFISFAVILSAYFILKGSLDMEGILNEMQAKSRITAKNFILIGLYITFINSFLEEFFFRGFIFLNLYKLNMKKTAYIYSSLLFGLYHIGIFKNWFNPYLIGLALLGLISVGFVFDYLDTKSENFINSWLVHILADSSIILIGLRMFKII